MDIQDFLKELENKKVPIDFAKYGINLLSYHIINNNYLKAILEAQLQIMIKLNDNPDIDPAEHLKIIEDRFL